MNQITIFLPKYRELNDIISNVIKNNGITYQDQKTITEFYNQYSDVKIFEQMILNIIQNKESQTYSLLLPSIKSIIAKNINTYTSASDQLNTIDIAQIYTRQNKWTNEIIDRQIKITNECYQELLQVNKTLDNLGYREHSPQEEVQLWRRHKQLTQEYNNEKEKLSKLYEEQKASLDEFLKYNKNLFSKIHALSISFLSVINSYYSTREEVQKKEEKKKEEHGTIMKDGLYFDMKIVALIHDECNNIQFENLSQTELYTILNLQPISKIPIVKPRQKIRICYLIYKLYEFLKLDIHDKLKWREAILDSFEIEERYYLSKYKEPESEFASAASQDFSLRIREIFK